jgi:hypothetical protein
VVRAGVYDPDPERAAAFAAAAGHTCARARTRCSTACDAVYICTWTSEHARQVAKAVERGLASSARSRSRCRPRSPSDGDRRWSSRRRHEPGGPRAAPLAAYLWARHLIDDPAAGRVMSVVFRDDQFIPIQGHYASRRGAPTRTKVGAGTLLEHSIHDVDMLRFLVGDVAASARTPRTSTATTASRTSPPPPRSQRRRRHAHQRVARQPRPPEPASRGGVLRATPHRDRGRRLVRPGQLDRRRRHRRLARGRRVSPRARCRCSTGSTTPTASSFAPSSKVGRPPPTSFTAVEAHQIVDAMYRSAAGDGELVRLDG